MPAGLRPGSLYYEAYYRLRKPLIHMMLDGVAWDAVSAKEQATGLIKRKDELKDRLDVLTGGVHLYTFHRQRSDGLKQLLSEQRKLRAHANSLQPRSEQRKLANADVKQIQERIKSVRSAGGDVTVTRGDGLSDKSIGEYLYGTLGVPEQRRRRKTSGTSTPTVDERALLKVKQSHPQFSELLETLLEHRRCEKLVSTYLNPDQLVSPTDGRFHSQYKPYGTQTLRLSSSSDPWGHGGNAQNLDREFKWLMLPDLPTEENPK